jgi:hypothetical protein
VLGRVKLLKRLKREEQKDESERVRENEAYKKDE